METHEHDGGISFLRAPWARDAQRAMADGWLRRARAWVSSAAVGLALAASGGCTAYAPEPLVERPTLVDSYGQIRVHGAQLPVARLSQRPFARGGLLDLDDVATLAVLNNPELKVARADAGVSRAQGFAAGLLPDPQLALTRDVPQQPQPGATSAFSLNLTQDVAALLRRHFDRRAGELEVRKADLSLLWQEWQVVAKARTLVVKLIEEQRLMAALQQNRALFLDRYQRTQAALDRGLLTTDAVTPHLTALQDVDRQLRDLERQVNGDRLDLNALLGLVPDAVLPLDEALPLPVIDEQNALAQLAQAPRQRPDLLALMSGYQAQDERYRAAIAGQFPTLTVGFTRARDTSGVYTHGFGATLSLPFFNGNRGNIAVEKATRQRLRQDFEARLNAAQSDVHRILSEERINARQLRDIDAAITALSRAAANADRAFQARGIDALAYVNLRTSLLSKQIEKINLEQSILQQWIALQALLGSAAGAPQP